MVDALKRKLRVPGKFLPYLEKHRIYELLNEVTNALIIKQPNDHTKFMRDKLAELMIKKDMPRILLIAPPYFDVSCLALQLANVTGSLCISLSNVLECASLHANSLNSVTPQELAKYTKDIIKANPQNTHGWIIHGLPRNRTEALAMQKAGILPTHTFQLLPSSIEETVPFCSPRALSLSMTEIQNGSLQHRRRLLGLIDAYRSTLHEVHVTDKTMEQIVDTCFQLTRIVRPFCGAPMLPRVVIIGSRGSGAKVQARLLSKRFNIIHVCFEDVMEKEKLEDSEFGSKIQLHINNNVNVPNTIMASVLEKRIMKRDCLDYGWVLTGYPMNVDQFKALDLMDTPPNRVIFLEVDPGVCLKRLALRRSNIYTGSQHHLEINPPTGKSQKQMGVHPKDKPSNIANQLKCYQEDLPDMLEYSMGTETLVNGNSPIRKVFERVEAVIIRPQCATLFRGCVKDIIPIQTDTIYPIIPTVQRKNCNDIEDVECLLKANKGILEKKSSNSNKISNIDNESLSVFNDGPIISKESLEIILNDTTVEHEVENNSMQRESELDSEIQQGYSYQRQKSKQHENERDNHTTSSDIEKDLSEIFKIEEQYKQKPQIISVNTTEAKCNLFSEMASGNYPEHRITINAEQHDDLENLSGKGSYSEENEAGVRTETEQKMGKVVFTNFGAQQHRQSRVSMYSPLETVREERSDEEDSGPQKDQ